MGVLTRVINGFSVKTNAFSVFQGEALVRALSPPVPPSFCGCWPRSWWSRRRWRSPSPHAAEVLLVAVAGFGLVAVAGLALHILEC